MSSQTNTKRSDLVEVRRGAKALVTAADRVLLVKETHADGSSFWTLPGGGVERSESCADALHREVLEELSCQTEIEGHRGRFWYAHASCDNTLTRYTVFDCSLISRPQPNQSEGILDKRWVHPTALPATTLLPVRHCLKLQFD